MSKVGKKKKALSLIIVLAMVISLVAVLPASTVFADDEDVDIVSYADLVGDITDLDDLTDVEDFDGVDENDIGDIAVDFVSAQSGGAGVDFRGFNIATVVVEDEDDNEALLVTNENPEIQDVTDQDGRGMDVWESDRDEDTGNIDIGGDVVFHLSNAPINISSGDACDHVKITLSLDGDLVATLDDGDCILNSNPDADEFSVNSAGTLDLVGPLDTPIILELGGGTATFDEIVVEFAYWDAAIAGFYTQNVPLMDRDGDGDLDTDDVIIGVNGDVTGPIEIDPDTGLVKMDRAANSIPPSVGDEVEVDYAHSDVDSIDVDVTSDSEPTRASGKGLEVDFAEGGMGVSEDSDFFLFFALLITEDDEETLRGVLADEPLGEIGDIGEFIEDVESLLDDDSIDLDGMESAAWVYAAKGVVQWQELIADRDADVDVDGVVDLKDDPADFFDLTLVVSDLDDVMAESGDADDEVIADLTAPEADVQEPDSGTITNDADPTFKVEFTDPGADDEVGSGIDLDAMDENRVRVTSPDVGGPLVSDGLTELDDATVGADEFSVTGVDDGFRLKITLDDVDDDDYTWGVIIEDRVGNLTDLTGGFSLTIDTEAPDILAAVTGLGVSDSEEVSDDDGIRVSFDSGIDSTTLEADDFDVTGASPLDAVANFEELDRTEAFAGDGATDAFGLEDASLDLDGDGEFLDDVTVLIETTDDASGDETAGDNVLIVDTNSPVADLDGDGDIDPDDVTVVVDNLEFDVDDVNGSTITTVDAVPIGADIVITYAYTPTVGDDDPTDNEIEGLPAFDGATLTLEDPLADGDTLWVTYTFDASAYVYLTVAGLDPASEPDVSLVDDADGIDDVAGNTEDDIEDVGVDDAIAPVITVTTGSLIGDAEELTITITSSEELDTRPTVTINGVEIRADEIFEISSTEWVLTVTGGDADFGAGADGFSLIEVTGEDENGNETTVSVIGGNGLEVDLAINNGDAPRLAPGDGAEVFQGIDNIVRLDVSFDGEAGEYTGDERDGVTITSALLAWNTIQLLEENDSGQTGTATLTPVGNQTWVDIDVTPGISGIQHVHVGSCGTDTLGGVVYDLGTIGADGTSSTLLDVPMADLQTGGFAINLHDATDPSIYTSCGNIVAAQDLTADAFSDADQIDWGFGVVLPEGEYTLSLLAEDEAGNGWTDSIDFTVISPADFTISIDPGWNLISVPTRLDSASLDSVFGTDDPAITKVRTWNSTDGWLVSNFVDGAWDTSGGIRTIRNGVGYWVFSNTADDLDVTLRRITGVPVAPQPQVATAGWNLLGPQFFGLPVDGADEVDADAYLVDVDWTVAYRFNPAPAVGLERIAPDGDATSGAVLEAGMGYLLWLNADGEIIP